MIPSNCGCSLPYEKCCGKPEPSKAYWYNFETGEQVEYKIPGIPFKTDGWTWTHGEPKETLDDHIRAILGGLIECYLEESDKELDAELDAWQRAGKRSIHDFEESLESEEDNRKQPYICIHCGLPS